MKLFKKSKSSLQELIGIDGFTKYGLSVGKYELLFYIVRPTNISVLSKSSIEAKIYNLKMLLSAIPELEISCIDSAESFEDNKNYLKERAEKEDNLRVREIINKDLDFLDETQNEMSSSRQFMFILRLKTQKEKQIFESNNIIEKSIFSQGFEVRRMSKDEIKRFLALYFSTSLNGELIPDSEVFGKETKTFFDVIYPTAVKFLTDRFILGDTHRCVWAIREYPPSTQQQAILSRIAEHSGVTLRIYNRAVEGMEQRKIIRNADRKNRLKTTDNDIIEVIEAEGNLKDVAALLDNLRENPEPLLHTAVYIELKAGSEEKLRELQNEISIELARAKITVDRLTLRQKEGFLSSFPAGFNQFGVYFERVLPVSSVANLYPFSFSGKTDPQGLYIGRDKYGTNILVDFDRRAEDKTTSNVLILGNSGQGKSYLLKLILTNIRESGKSVICLDPEGEYEEICSALGGCYIDFMSGEHIINPLEPKSWGERDEDSNKTPLSQHIAFLKDFFRSYKDFTDAQIDTLEIMLSKLYKQYGITDSTNLSEKEPSDYPIMQELYNLCDNEYKGYKQNGKALYTEDSIREVCLGLHSMCVGAESRYFNGYTNIDDDEVIVFGVKGLLDTNKKLRNAMLFNILSYMSNKLLSKGNTVAFIDELYLFLTNMTTIEYIRNAMKRVRKKDSSIILASQNIEDFLIPDIREFTKPLFSIPTHQFLFNAGQINPKEYMEALLVEPSEFELIKYPQMVSCLYRCCNERYLLQVTAPEYKAKLFGRSGGR